MANYLWLLLNLPLLVAGIPVLVGAYHWRQEKKPYLKILFFYCLYTFLLEWVLWILLNFNIENLFLIHFAVPIEFYFILAIWIKQGEIKKHRNFLFILAGLLTAIAIFETAYINKFDSLPSISLVSSSVMVILIILIYFNESLKQPDSTSLLNQSTFYLASGFLIYFGFSVFYFLLYNKINKEFNEIIGSIGHSIVNCIYYLFLTKAFLCRPKAKII